jgi:hypothetical protein
MKYAFIPWLVCVLLFGIAGCSNNVPEISDPHNIIVDGKKMTQAEFLEIYCQGQSGNTTCLKVLQAKHKDSTRGVMPTW